uniref:Uncharacterized protein n=1 Tax=Ciona savignyi TaxID=51511 RepID=H2YE90_CIOSA
FNIQGMDITSVLLFLLVVVLVFLWNRRGSGNFPPGFDGVPLLGCIPLFGVHRERSIAEWGREKGWPIFYIKLGITKVVVLNTFESIEEAFVKKGQYFVERHIPIFLKRYSKGGKGNVCFPMGRFGNTSARFGIHTLRDLGMGKSGMENKIQSEIEHLSDYLVNSPNIVGKKSVDIVPIITKAVSNIICQLVFNTRFNLDDKITFIDSAAGIKLVKNASWVRQVKMTLCYVPLLNRIPTIAKLKQEREALHNTRHDLLRKYIQMHKETLDKGNPRDFIDAFLIAGEQDKEENSSFNDEQLLFYIQDLFFGGTDTTSFTLTWTFLYLSLFPEKQKRLHDEIDEVIGSSGNISMSFLEKMPYAQAVMQEIFRVRPLVPLGMPRKCGQNISLMGHNLPKDTSVIPNIWSAHHNPDRWPEPDSFLPERHIDSNGNFIKSKDIIPFMLGPRNCLGIRLAEMEHFMFMVGLLQKLQFALPAGQGKVDTRGSSSIVLLLPPDVDLVITSR